MLYLPLDAQPSWRKGFGAPRHILRVWKGDVKNGWNFPIGCTPRSVPCE